MLLGALIITPSIPAEAGGAICKDGSVPAPTPTPFVPPPAWEGFYFGGNIGGAWGDISDERMLQFFFPKESAFFRTGGMSGSGLFGGFQLGYNWQAGNCCFAFGIEADIGGMDLGIKRQTFLVPGGDATFAAFRIDGSGGFYGDITGRLGYSWGRALIYAKGGVAWFNPDISVNQSVVTGGATSFFANHNDGTLTGWTVGGGVEYMINPRWKWKIEYMHFDFSNNDSNCCFDGANNTRFLNNDVTANTIKIGFNYAIHPIFH